MADGLLPEGNEAGRSETQGLIHDWPLWVLMAADWGLGLWLLPRLPRLVPLHWGFSGQADGWGSPLTLVVALPLVTAGIYAVMLGLRRWGLDVMSGFLLSEALGRQLRWLAVTLLCGVHIALLVKCLGTDTGEPRSLFLAIALGFIFAGNILPRMEPNPTTAPTPERRALWRVIYRRAGHYLVVAGLFQAATVWLPSPMLLFTVLGSMLLASLDPVIRIARLRAYRPGAVTSIAEENSEIALLSWHDILPLAGLPCAFFAHHLLPNWVWLGAPLIAWLLLLAEAGLTKGEVKRVSVQMRGWVVLGLELAIASGVFLAFGQLIPILAGLAAINLSAAAGQILARRSATQPAKNRWGQGPVIWDPTDPRLFAPKGLGLGWTFNFARVSSWLLLVGMLGFMFWIAYSPTIPV